MLRRELEDGRSDTGTRTDLRATAAELRAEIYRAMLLQALDIVGLTVGILRFLG